MVSSQQEAGTLFLSSDADGRATPSEHCAVVYPQTASAKVHLLDLHTPSMRTLKPG